MKINEKNMCAFAKTPPFDMEGYLNKQGEINKAFQRRYFVLKGNLLFYFEKKSDKEPLGLIIVEGCTIELSEGTEQYCFEIAFDGNRTYVLAADCQESMESWMKSLTCAGYEYKRLILNELQRQLDEVEELQNRKQCQCAAEKQTTPKPPPRRQNPFNRPPVQEKEIVSAKEEQQLPFISGHFGKSKLSNAAGTQPRTMRNGRSAFYVETAVDALNTEPAIVASIHVRPSKPARRNEMRCDSAESNGEFRSSFERLFAEVNALVSRDIEEYHRRKVADERPLIDL